MGRPSYLCIRISPSTFLAYVTLLSDVKSKVTKENETHKTKKTCNTAT